MMNQRLWTACLLLIVGCTSANEQGQKGNQASTTSTARAADEGSAGPTSSAESGAKSSATSTGSSRTSSTSSGAAPIAKKNAEPRAPTTEELSRYGWLTADVKIRPLDAAIVAPKGFRRVELKPGSFGQFLRELPLRPAGAPVKTYKGEVLLEPGDSRFAAVAELDVSKADLQQCADSVIRLHGEWKWSSGQRDSIGYHFLSGDYATWPRYSSGERPVEKGNKIAWAAKAKPADDHATFRKYLDMVFNYASTISLANKTGAPIDKSDVAPGDYFVLPGGPGHAILILDVATDDQGHTVALLGQGYMPAQDFHVIVPPGSSSPWFSFDGEEVDTPFWPAPFPWSSLRRFK